MTGAETMHDEDSDIATRWRAVVDRDRACDGAFVYSVATTGVYCRPSCPSRRAGRANVRFHATPAAARAAGFRPCLRCRPDDVHKSPHATAIETACRLLERAEPMPKLAELARGSGLSPHYFHRVFKQMTGVTVGGYTAAVRAARLRRALHDVSSVTEAALAAGFGSSARFYAQAPAVLGMAPRVWRAGGAGETLTYAVAPCSLGALLVASSDIGVCVIALGDESEALIRALHAQFSAARLVEGDSDYRKIVAMVVDFVTTPQTDLDLPLDIRGTAFQQRVWAALRAIPSGRTLSYAELAARIGRASAVRAVANACAANQIAVAIPCHRAVRSDGALSGYRWGVARKRALLDAEAARRSSADDE